MKMNRIAAAALAGTMLTAPVLAEDAAWTPPTVTQEEMDAVQLGERILMRGTEGDDVRLVQQRLYDLGYLTDKVDGKFGLQTQKAVRAFQRAHQAGEGRRQSRQADPCRAFRRRRDCLADAYAQPDAVPVADPRSDGNPCSYACADRDAGFGERAVCDAES